MKGEINRCRRGFWKPDGAGLYPIVAVWPSGKLRAYWTEHDAENDEDDYGRPYPKPERYEELFVHNSRHCQALLDMWYDNVMPLVILKPKFREWLENFLSERDACVVIGSIDWIDE